MALTFTLERITGWREKCYVGPDLNPVTHALVFATMAVGLGEITEQNADEFAGRLHVVQSLNGGMLVKQSGPQFVRDADVREHIGLRTNVKSEARSTWLKRYVGGEVDDIARRYRRNDEHMREAVA